MISDGELRHCIAIWNRNARMYPYPEWLGFGTPLHLAEEDPKLMLTMDSDRVIEKATYDGRVIFDMEDASHGY